MGLSSLVHSPPVTCPGASFGQTAPASHLSPQSLTIPIHSYFVDEELIEPTLPLQGEDFGGQSGCFDEDDHHDFYRKSILLATLGALSMSIRASLSGCSSCLGIGQGHICPLDAMALHRVQYVVTTSRGCHRHMFRLFLQYLGQ